MVKLDFYLHLETVKSRKHFSKIFQLNKFGITGTDLVILSASR